MYYKEEKVHCCTSITGIHGLLVSEIRIYSMVFHVIIIEIYKVTKSVCSQSLLLNWWWGTAFNLLKYDSHKTKKAVNK